MTPDDDTVRAVAEALRHDPRNGGAIGHHASFELDRAALAAIAEPLETELRRLATEQRGDHAEIDHLRHEVERLTRDLDAVLAEISRNDAACDDIRSPYVLGLLHGWWDKRDGRAWGDPY